MVRAYPCGACSCLCFRRNAIRSCSWAWRVEGMMALSAPDSSESYICSYTRANGGRLAFAPAAPDLSQYIIADYALASSSVVSAA